MAIHTGSLEGYEYAFSPTLKYNCQKEVIDHIKGLSNKERKEVHKYYMDRIEHAKTEVKEYWVDVDYIEGPDYELEIDHILSLYKLLETTSWWITEIINPPLPPIRKPRPTFESLFKDKDHAAVVRSIFETYDYTKMGQWVGLSNFKYELHMAQRVLMPLLKKDPKASVQALIFYLEFGFEENDSLKRRLRDEPVNPKMQEEFERIFSKLLLKTE